MTSIKVNPTIKVDLLQMELEQKLPHWLDPSQRYPENYQAIRDKNRAKWLAEQKAKREKALQLRQPGHDVSDEPRDEAGKWTEGGGDGGGGGEHPGEGYSKNARVDANGVIHTNNVYDAARALGEHRKVELNQPKQVSTLIHELGREAQKMQKAGAKAPIFNLCDVSVKGTNLFCVDTKGIPRIEMPQMDDQQTKDFRSWLKEKGYKVKKDDERAANLRATQNELNGAKVAAVMDHLEHKGDHQSKRLIISKDDYILDGHHHWAAKLGLDAADGDLTNDTKMKIARVNVGITKLLELAEEFTGGKGHAGVEAGIGKKLS